MLLETAGVRFDYTREAVIVPAEVEQVLAMVLREAVTNIQRHAGAHRAEARLESDDVLLRLVVCDDGRGGPISVGNGLRGMRERIEALGGRLRIESPSGGGACLQVWLPLPEAPTEPASEAISVTPRGGDEVARAAR